MTTYEFRPPTPEEAPFMERDEWCVVIEPAEGFPFGQTTAVYFGLSRQPTEYGLRCRMGKHREHLTK